MRTCTKCLKEKPVGDFHRDRRRKSGRMARCADCNNKRCKEARRADPARTKDIDARRYQANRGKERERHILKKYGVSLKDYEERFVQQNGRCAICRRPATKTLDIDHNHKTGAVRGLLCTSCNRMIGHAGDVPETLIAAAEYLRRNP